MDEKLVINVELKLDVRSSRYGKSDYANDWHEFNTNMEYGEEMADKVASRAKEMYLANYADLLANLKEWPTR